MVKFNVDSLDFVDDETARFGEDADFDLGFDSANSRLELDDLSNGVTAHVPQNREGDLVDGRLAQAVDEGKALADDGVVYDTIQSAVDNASSWVKIGPGHFNETVTLFTAGISLVGSGEQTVIEGKKWGIILNSTEQYVADLAIRTTTNHYGIGTGSNGDSSTIENVSVLESGDQGIRLADGANHTVRNCDITDVNSIGIDIRNAHRTVVVNTSVSNTATDHNISLKAQNSVIAYCNITNSGSNGIQIGSGSYDSIIYGNRISDATGSSLRANGTNSIVVNNRVSDSSIAIDNDSNGSLVQDNLTASSN